MVTERGGRGGGMLSRSEGGMVVEVERVEDDGGGSRGEDSCVVRGGDVTGGG